MARVAVDRLLGTRALDRDTGVYHVIVPPREERIALFLQALLCVSEYRADVYWYPQYVCTILGYRRLVQQMGPCHEVDLRIRAMLSDDPWIIPSDCYAYRLPWSSTAAESARLLRRRFLMTGADQSFLRTLAAD